MNPIDKVAIIKGSGMSLFFAYLAYVPKKLGYKVVYDGEVI